MDHFGLRVACVCVSCVHARMISHIFAASGAYLGVLCTLCVVFVLCVCVFLC